MKLKRARRSRRGRIEIIPMIDVMFFLLASYLLTSLSMQRLDALSIALPDGTASAFNSAAPLTLSIDRNDRIEVAGQRVTLAEVGPAVRARLHRDGTLVVAADDKATQGTVTRAMLEAQHAGARSLSIVIRHAQ
ncbi:ExbD/TolR family protein [Pararobbsia silviterrae]|uniref:Biopolymer transporter ExbD n=1 Tax=Pararobbsia silviterrae TaxID=1792498 RepID=A0A494XEL5_9BURK|nr:biopolymer transporter ExbD [Pararobbsia silviterrae]RKP46584.1 biopolymer transporter ExbD [Pararobbsia silviterrae]